MKNEYNGYKEEDQYEQPKDRTGNLNEDIEHEALDSEGFRHLPCRKNIM